MPQMVILPGPAIPSSRFQCRILFDLSCGMKASPFNLPILQPAVMRKAAMLGRWRRGHVPPPPMSRDRDPSVVPVTFRERVAIASGALKVLGSGLTDQSQKMTVAARAMAEKKALGHRS